MSSTVPTFYSALHHISLGRTTYARAHQIQSVIFEAFLNAKPPFSKLPLQSQLPLVTNTTSTRTSSAYKLQKPVPSVITFECDPPAYTSGRRQLGKISQQQKIRLCFPTRQEQEEKEQLDRRRRRSSSSRSRSNISSSISSNSSNRSTGSTLSAEFHEALRGGQITFHGPGQLIAYPIISLQVENDKGAQYVRGRPTHLGTRTYVGLIEEATISVLEAYGVGGVESKVGVDVVRRSTYPGVWVEDRERINNAYEDYAGWERRKIASVGVHCKRYITSHGMALNVTKEPLWWFGRFTACGIAGIEVTSLEKELSEEYYTGVTVEEVGKKWVELLAKRLNKRVVEVELEDVIDLQKIE